MGKKLASGKRSMLTEIKYTISTTSRGLVLFAGMGPEARPLVEGPALGMEGWLNGCMGPSKIEWEAQASTSLSKPGCNSSKKRSKLS